MPTDVHIDPAVHPITTALTQKIQADFNGAGGDLAKRLDACASAIEQLLGAIALLEGQINRGDAAPVYKSQPRRGDDDRVKGKRPGVIL